MPSSKKLTSLIFDSEIGTAKDNHSSPLHDWYRFTAGFSYKLVDEIIKIENLSSKDIIYESFAGCGTTLVTAQKIGVGAVGNEGQELLYDVIRAKLNWEIDKSLVLKLLADIKVFLDSQTRRKKLDAHELLYSLYDFRNLRELCLIRDYISENLLPEPEYLFLKIALTQTLHKTCIHPISIPYIVRSKTLTPGRTWDTFETLVIKMLSDLMPFEHIRRTSEIYLHDSRTLNDKIDDSSCSVCITSPPYLNNLDYGEISKVSTHFFGITNSWNEITNKVRKNLVTGSTTHYVNSSFNLSDWKCNDFYLANSKVGKHLIEIHEKIKEIGKCRGGKKSFDILTLLYFEDMYKVLIEINRVLNKNASAYLVLGDSAPYGVYIDTCKILGEIAKSVGFKNYNIQQLRQRGHKWKTLTHRHSLALTESILILKK